MKTYFMIVLVSALTSLSSGCAQYTLHSLIEADTARAEPEDLPNKAVKTALDLKECEHKIEKNASALGGGELIIEEGTRKNLMVMCMRIRGYSLAELPAELQ